MRLHPRTEAAKESIFPRMSGLAQRLGAVNLGQGFPSNPPPPFLLEAVRRALGRQDQYAPPAGLPALREALAEEFADYLHSWQQVIVDDLQRRPGLR